MRMSDNPAGVPSMQLEAQEKCDVLVAGCGIAGLSAALAAAEAGARVTLLCAGEVFSGSSFYPGTWGFGLIGPENADDKTDLAESILRVGCGMANPALVDTFVNGIAPAIENLRGMGVALRRAAAAGEREFIPCFDHKRRDWNGIEQASAREVFARRLEALGVKVYAECEVLELVKAEGWVCGAIVFYGGELCYLPCGAFVLATGGFGALLQHHLCTGDVMGTGQALALRAGAALTNLEFFQIMPGYLSPAYGTVFNEKAFRFSEITAGGTPLLAGEEAERLLAQRSTHGPFTARLESRAVDIALAKALETDAAGAAVRYTAAMKAAPPEFIRTYFDWLRDAKGLTMEDTVYIGHFAHAANGGVRIAPDGGTGVPGLFACGEVTGGMHGADRIGGLSTANGLVFGGIAGRAAAATGRKERALPRTAAFTPWAWDGIFAARVAMQSTMGQNAMVLRSEAGLAQAVQTLSALRGAPQRPARLALEAAASAQLSAQLLTAECIVKAAKLRKESRGAHYRIDHPEQSAACAGRIEITAAEGEISARFVYDEA